MSPLNHEQLEQLAAQRVAMKRYARLGRRWYLRGGLMFVVACFAGYRGGGVNHLIGIAMVVLAALCFSLGRSMRKSVRDSEAKIALMEKT